MVAPSFMNETDRATWTTVMPGLSEYLHATVAPGGSCTDEFIVETERIGKFRLAPAADRRYSWMECDLHDIVRESSPALTFRLAPRRRPTAGEGPRSRTR